MELSNEDLEGRILKQQEENHRLRNFNQELDEQIKKLKDDKQLQDGRFENIQNNNNLLENKLVQIQKEASRLSEKQIQVEEVKEVLFAVKKEEKKQHMHLIDIQIIIIILTNDRVKMNIQRRLILTCKNIDILSNN